MHNFVLIFAILPTSLQLVAMVFGYDVPVKFSVEGACKAASVHLSGYFQPGPEDDEDEEDDDEDEDGNFTILFIHRSLSDTKCFHAYLC